MPMPDLIEEMLEEPPRRDQYFTRQQAGTVTEPEPQEISGDLWRAHYAVKRVAGQDAASTPSVPWPTRSTCR